MLEQIAEKMRVLKTVIGSVEKQFGKGAIMTLGDEGDVEPVQTISTGSLALDLATGIGGYPRGRVVEIYGPESSGKTTLALHAIAEAQKQDGVCAFIDAEHALDVQYAKGIGVDIERLLVSQPDTGEQALEIAEMLVRSGAIDLVVVDSVAALTPKAEIEGEMGDQHMGLQARLMSQALRKLTAITHRNGTVIVFIKKGRRTPSPRKSSRSDSPLGVPCYVTQQTWDACPTINGAGSGFVPKECSVGSRSVRFGREARRGLVGTRRSAPARARARGGRRRWSRDGHRSAGPNDRRRSGGRETGNA